MIKIHFLSIDEVKILHSAQIVDFGGLPGLRDLGLLESAIFAPQATFAGHFLCKDIF